MQHEMMRLPTPSIASDNIGDVLASIRQLIAQDAAGCRIANAALNVVPAAAVASVGPVTPMPAAGPPDITPLILASNDLVAPDPLACTATGAGLQLAPLAFVKATDAGTRGTDPVASDSYPSASPADPAPAHQPIAVPCPEPALSDAQAAVQAPSAGNVQTDAPLITNLQMEETMLHVNASVTPITPALDAQATTDAPNRDSAGMHLFAPEEKGAQKGNHLRGMIRDAIRQELQGEIGTRLSRNLQTMIRQEVELTLRQMCEQD